jgi:tritrans,polycis-undecaprenyl-diphosphate synthase [geranylgeranyl-diphosphate specific]
MLGWRSLLSPGIGSYVKNGLSKPIYGFYERRLEAQVRKGAMPTHVGLILDGNRRWAKEMGFDTTLGHRYGFEKLKDVLRWCWGLGIHIVTVYALSVENLQRDQHEVEDLMNLLSEGFSDVLQDSEIHSNRVQVKAIGRLELLSEDLRRTITRAEEATKGYAGYTIYVAVAYGGRAEIIDASKKILTDALAGRIRPEEVTEETFSKYLYTGGESDPDLIMRTSGEERLSGFLLWQSAYAEFCFIDVFWPDMRRIDLLRALRTYQKRKRNYGI